VGQAFGSRTLAELAALTAGSADFFLAVILYSMAGLVAVVQVVGARRKKRSGGSRAAR
jgi:hypothetical protein